MTREELEALLSQLDVNRERAAERYENIRRRLIRFFEWRACSAPEVLADVTIDRAAKRMAEGIELRSSDPYSYFCGIAHLVYKEELRRASREHRALESGEVPLPVVFHEEEDLEDRRLEGLRHCLDLLPEDQRSLVLRYHQGENNIRNRRVLSEELGLPMNALRIRVHRVRRKLAACLQERLRP